MGAAVAYILCLSPVTAEVPKLSIVGHEWLAKLSTATGALCHRAVLLECHQFVVSMSNIILGDREEKPKGQQAAAAQAALHSLVAVASDVAVAAPSPSQLLVMWEDIREIVQAFEALVANPSDGGSRQKVTRLLQGIGSTVSLSSQTGAGTRVESSEVLEVSGLWDDYRSWSEDVALVASSSSSAEVVTSYEWSGLQPTLWYTCTFVHGEKRRERYATAGRELLNMADTLMQVSCNQSLCALLTESGMRFLLEKSSGVESQGLTIGIASAAYSSILFRWVSVSPAMRLSQKVAVSASAAPTSADRQIVSAVSQRSPLNTFIVTDPEYLPQENNSGVTGASSSCGVSSAFVSRRVKTAILDQIAAAYGKSS
jgi:hypothetical protein